MEMCDNFRGVLIDMEFFGKERVNVKYEFPLSEIVSKFYDKLKTVSSGYASFEYEAIEVLSHCYTAATLLLRCCYTVVTILSQCSYTVVTLFLHCCYTVVTLFLHYCHTVLTLLLHCRYTVVILSHRCYTVVTLL
jgi:hypothetical protein